MALILIIPDDRGKTLASFFFKDFIYLFLESWEGREKEKERNINVWLPLPYSLLESWPATQTCALTGNWTSDPLVHRPEFNPPSHTSQDWLLYYKKESNLHDGGVSNVNVRDNLKMPYVPITSLKSLGWKLWYLPLTFFKSIFSFIKW